MKSFISNVVREFTILVVSVVLMVSIVLIYNLRKDFSADTAQVNFKHDILEFSREIDQLILSYEFSNKSVGDLPLDRIEAFKIAFNKQMEAFQKKYSTEYSKAAIRLYLLEFFKQFNNGSLRLALRHKDVTDRIVLQALAKGSRKNDIKIYESSLPDAKESISRLTEDLILQLKALDLNEASEVFHAMDFLKIDKEVSNPTKMMLSVAFSVMMFSVIALLISIILSRRVALVYTYLQGREDNASSISLKLLTFVPYLFIVPTFIIAAIIPGSWFRAPILKFILLIFVMVVSGGVSFELLLKYFDESRKEYDKPYIKFLKMLKGQQSNRLSEHLHDAGILIRKDNVVQSQSLSPYVLRSCDFRLLPFARRRMGSLVDTYAIAGLVLSYRFWGDSEYSDVSSALQESAISYGMSIEYVWLLVAIIVGLFAARIFVMAFEYIVLGEKE
ncbi:MAG: hypothetical protein PHV91_01220 [Bacteroidales bacterium]|jgi:hypothetical protein|nr:hypothetical protein [Candidatus Cloacimonadota bacterium]MCB5269252.1 hypothetical protein [Candidatus Cloacimonadota bacterium]MDD3299440.1 hypothetical protein [Bacteroidales bacterium]